MYPAGQTPSYAGWAPPPGIGQAAPPSAGTAPEQYFPPPPPQQQVAYLPPPAPATFRDPYSGYAPQQQPPELPPSDCCAPSASGPLALTDSFSVAAYAFSTAGALALGLACLSLVSTGWAVMSSLLVIAQGCLLRSAGASPAAVYALRSESPSAPQGCCCSRRSSNLRGLAIAAIVFAVLELLLGLGLGLGLGIALGLPNDGSLKNSANSYLRVCGATNTAGTGALSCLNTVTSADMVYLPSSSSSSSSAGTTPLALLRRQQIGGSQYLLWAAGTTAFTAAANIGLSALTIQLSNMLPRLK